LIGHALQEVIEIEGLSDENKAEIKEKWIFCRQQMLT